MENTTTHNPNKQPQAALSPDQALAYLGKGAISRSSFYQAIHRGEVPHVRIGKRILIPRNRFEQWLEGCATKDPQAL